MSEILYKCPGPHAGPYGTCYTYAHAKDEVALGLLLQGGWCKTLDEAIKKAGTNAFEVVKPTKKHRNKYHAGYPFEVAELEAEAKIKATRKAKK